MILRRLFIAICFLSAICMRSDAHIGNSAVFYEGNAGPYAVRVFVQPPEVVPGLAEINVRIHDLKGTNEVTQVSALPVRWDAGRKGAPPPDVAVRVKGETNLYNTQLWLMSFGAYSVFVDVDGTLGKGTAIVPLNSVSSQRLAMPRWMGGVFLGAGIGLVLLLVCIVGAAVRESTLAMGESVNRKRRIWASVVMVLAGVFISAALWKGKSWWDSVDADFRHHRLYKPQRIESGVVKAGDSTKVALTIDDRLSDGRDSTPLVADHGKLMHLFLVREPGMEAFAHLHPISSQKGHFESDLHGLPAGSYSVFADVVHESGLTETYISSLQLDGAAGESTRGAAVETSGSSDPDDSYWVAKTNDLGGVKIRAVSTLTLQPRKECELKFMAVAADGAPAPLEPYMGMWSHAVICSEDGTVFTHLHPAGTISMTSQELFARRERGESVRAKPIEVICGRPERELVFPYSFPKAGNYKMWVQVKSNGEICTGAFDIAVK